MTRKAKAIGLISGGLDSTLALSLVKQQGIEVKAVTFYTGFCIAETQRRRGGRADGSMPRNEALRAAADLESDVELVDISGPEYLEMVLHPRFGYGANANPCVDCRIFMMRKAKEIMEREGADFVFTGEVLGQRPKSQRRDTLSAKLLKPTVAEQEGLVDRERLLDVSGRGRQRQIALAGAMGLTDWPQPAGGCCFLTDESFSRKFFDLLSAREAAGEGRRITKDEVVLLTVGRHFRLSPRAKLVVGRNEMENALLEHHVAGRARLEAPGVTGPVALVEGAPSPEDRQVAASIVARYGKGKDEPHATVEWREGDRVELLEVEPAHDEARLEGMRI
jgi:hypothetical protein